MAFACCCYSNCIVQLVEGDQMNPDSSVTIWPRINQLHTQSTHQQHHHYSSASSSSFTFLHVTGGDTQANPTASSSSSSSSRTLVQLCSKIHTANSIPAFIPKLYVILPVDRLRWNESKQSCHHCNTNSILINQSK